jgi:hypothetical protein
VAVLLDNYRTGNEFSNLRLIVDKARAVVSFHTVLNVEAIDGSPLARESSVAVAGVGMELPDHASGRY